MPFDAERPAGLPYAVAMTDVWSGTFTFVLTDIEGSTRLWEAAPADMARALARHDDLITTTVATHGGRLIRSRGEGDSAFAVFDDPNTALRCAVELQRALALEPWPPLAPIRVRAAIHTGPAQARSDDLFGPGVNRAARLRSIAHGGQLIISGDVQRSVESGLPDGIWLDRPRLAPAEGPGAPGARVAGRAPRHPGGLPAAAIA